MNMHYMLLRNIRYVDVVMKTGLCSKKAYALIPFIKNADLRVP
jgi:hypothetical protein